MLSFFYSLFWGIQGSKCYSSSNFSKPFLKPGQIYDLPMNAYSKKFMEDNYLYDGSAFFSETTRIYFYFCLVCFLSRLSFESKCDRSIYKISPLLGHWSLSEKKPKVQYLECYLADHVYRDHTVVAYEKSNIKHMLFCEMP